MSVAAFAMAQIGFTGVARRFESWCEELESEKMTAPDRAWAALLLGLAAYARLDVHSAERYLRHGAAVVARSSEPLRRAFVHSVLAFLLAQRGELTSARAVASAMISEGEIEGMSYLRFCGHSAAAVIAFLSGDHRAASAEIVSCYGIREAIGDDFSRMTTELQQRTYGALADPESDLQPLVHTVRAYQTRGFASAHLSFCTHALVSLVVGAGLRGALTPAFVRELSRLTRLEWKRVHRRFRQQRPLLLALRGALLHLRGKKRQAERVYKLARNEATRAGFIGELAPIAWLERTASMALRP
jgi:hypothetical protein